MSEASGLAPLLFPPAPLLFLHSHTNSSHWLYCIAADGNCHWSYIGVNWVVCVSRLPVAPDDMLQQPRIIFSYVRTLRSSSWKATCFQTSKILTITQHVGHALDKAVHRHVLMHLLPIQWVSFCALSITVCFANNGTAQCAQDLHKSHVLFKCITRRQVLNRSMYKVRMPCRRSPYSLDETCSTMSQRGPIKHVAWAVLMHVNLPYLWHRLYTDLLKEFLNGRAGWQQKSEK